MKQAIDRPAASNSEAAEPGTDNTVTHPAWCSPAWCWAYPASADAPDDGEEPRAGGFHESTTIVVPAGDGHEITLCLAQDHGSDAAPEIRLSPGGFGAELPQLLTMTHDAATALRMVLDSILSPQQFNAAAKLYELGISYAERQAATRADEAFRAGALLERSRVEQETAQLRQRLARADAERRQAYAAGYADAVDGRKPKFGATR